MTEVAVVATHLNAQQAAKAVGELLKYHEKKEAADGKTSLVGFYGKPILAVIELHESMKKSLIRPKRINLPNSIFDPVAEEHTMCYFCKSSDKKAIDEFISTTPIESLTRVISMDDIRKYFKAFKDLKDLIKQHTHFVCDSSIMTQLYNLLGKTFGQNSRQPIPITFKSVATLEKSLNTAVSATYMKVKGKTMVVRLGYTSMSGEQITANALHGLESACSYFENKWDSVASISLRTPYSPTLPIYYKLPAAIIAKSSASVDKIEVAVETKTEVKSGKKRKASKMEVVEEVETVKAIVEDEIVASKAKTVKISEEPIITAPVTPARGRGRPPKKVEEKVVEVVTEPIVVVVKTPEKPVEEEKVVTKKVVKSAAKKCKVTKV